MNSIQKWAAVFGGTIFIVVASRGAVGATGAEVIGLLLVIAIFARVVTRG